MHSYLTGFKVEAIDKGFCLTLYSPGGDYIFNIHETLMDLLIDKMVEKLYRLEDLEIEQDEQLELF